MRSSTLELDDGRTLSWAELGSESAPNALVANHGTGSSRLELAIYDAVFAELGLRVLAPERPGYGLSSALNRGRTVADWAEDVCCLVERLGIERFAVSGFSGGAAHALAIAASPTLCARVSRVSLSAGFAPGQVPRDKRDAEINTRAGRMPWQEFVHWFAHDAPDVDREFTAADQEALAEPVYLEGAMATLQEGARQGQAGAGGDMWALWIPWGFDLASISQRVDVWHGDSDTSVPLSHAHAFLSALPDAVLHILPGEGHYSIGRYVPQQFASAY